MAYANDIRTSSVRAEAGLFERVVAWFRGFVEADEQRKIYRQTVRELNSLSARDLSDLGIHASMIETLAYEAAYGKK